MSQRWAPVIRSASYDTPDNPKLIETPDHNGPKPTTPRTVTVVPFDDSLSLADRLLVQQWRDAEAAGTLANNPESINPVVPTIVDGD